MQVAIYARVSTDRQRERQTIRAQLRLLPEFATREGWDVVETYVDDGISGETVDARPAFQRLLADAERGLFETVLVIDLDRITRSRRSAEGALIFDHFREHGVKLATPTQGLIDLDDEDQDLLVGIKRELAKWEKRKILARTMRGKREAVRNGSRHASVDPYGYTWVRDPSNPRRGRYEQVSEEAKIVRRIFRMTAEENLGRAQVAWRLNSEGLRTRPTKKKPQGGRWATSTIGKMLRSSTYKGEFHVFKKDVDPITIPVPPIVSDELWAAAQHAIAERKPGRKWKHDRRYLLSGLVRCGVCGYAMWVVNARPHAHTKNAYYRCSSTNSWRRMGLEGPCGNKHHRVDLVDELVWERVSSLLADTDLLAEACALGESDDKRGVDWEAQLRAFDRKLRDLVGHESEVLARRRRGLLSSAACDRELGEIARERGLVERNKAVATRRLEGLTSRAGLRRTLEERVEELRHRLSEASFEERRQFMQALAPRKTTGGVALNLDGTIQIHGVIELGESLRADVRLDAGPVVATN